MCDRVLVLRDGAHRGELQRDEFGGADIASGVETEAE